MKEIHESLGAVTHIVINEHKNIKVEIENSVLFLMNKKTV